MAGIYLHIPFCKQACHYCNFHFSTSLRQKDAMLEALLLELELQRDYLGGQPLGSIYLGGGTPSLLTVGELNRLFEAVHRLHHVAPDAEITLEANPDDLTRERLRDLRDHSPVNRLSIGIQSFGDEDLRWMNRAHNARHARQCLDEALGADFRDLTIDLIYGAPTTSDAQWAQNLELACQHYAVPHLSCYGLTVEEGTALGTWVRRGQQKPLSEEQSARQFEMLMATAAQHGYEHYEISNFARPGHRAKHNSNYWLGEPYLGIGPSAHAFDGHSRQWNIAHNAEYIKALQEGRVPFEREVLSPEQRYNEYVMTSLRTAWGVSPERLLDMGAPFLAHFEHAVAPFAEAGQVERHEGAYRLSTAGKFLADRITVALFF
jgi:oxygen-independent coproporphyrinogen-3 oxidase